MKTLLPWEAKSWEAIEPSDSSDNTGGDVIGLKVKMQNKNWPTTALVLCCSSALQREDIEPDVVHRKLTSRSSKGIEHYQKTGKLIFLWDDQVWVAFALERKSKFSSCYATLRERESWVTLFDDKIRRRGSFPSEGSGWWCQVVLDWVPSGAKWNTNQPAGYK